MLLHLRLLVVFDTDLVDQLELLLEPIDVLLLRIENAPEEIAAHIVADALAVGDRILQQRMGGSSFLSDARYRQIASSLAVVVAFAVLIWSLLGPILFLFQLPISSNMSGLLKSIQRILGGLTLGIFLSLYLSGGLVAWYRKK